MWVISPQSDKEFLSYQQIWSLWSKGKKWASDEKVKSNKQFQWHSRLGQSATVPTSHTPPISFNLTERDGFSFQAEMNVTPKRLYSPQN